MNTTPTRFCSGMLLAALLLGLPAGGSLRAQDTNPVPPQANPPASVPATNGLSEVEDIMSDNDNGATDDAANGTELSDTNAPAETNAPTPAGPDARARRLNRQKQIRSRRSAQYAANNQAGTNAASGTTALDYSAFRLVAERNIFDPNRYPHTAPRPQPKTVESFSLVGTMSYEKGDFAFFDGTSSDYKRALKPSDTIAGYRVVAVSPDSVKLTRGTNELVLAVGTQMRRQDDGLWVQSAGGEAYAAAPANSTNASHSDTAASGAESDVLKRLMLRREKE